MIKTVSKPLAHLNFLSGVNCYDIGSNVFSLSLVCVLRRIMYYLVVTFSVVLRALPLRSDRS
jgi:hypothetical protein